jgi:hypothetical protein
MSAVVNKGDETIPPVTGQNSRLGAGGIAIAIIFGVVYAYDLWEAIAPMLDLPAVYAVVGLDPASVPWWLLIAGVALIPVVFAIAMFLGLRRNALEKALIFLVGLSIVACGSLVIIAVEAALRPSF